MLRHLSMQQESAADVLPYEETLHEGLPSYRMAMVISLEKKLYSVSISNLVQQPIIWETGK